MYFSFSEIFCFLVIIQVLQWTFLIFYFFQCFLPYYTSYSVCFSFSSFCCFLATIQVLKCLFLIFKVFHCFSPCSMSYSVCFSFCTFFSVSSHISYPTIWVSHFPHLSVFSPYSRSYSVCVSFYTFFRFLAIFQVLQCTFLICYIFSVSRHISYPTMWVSHFPHLSVFLPYPRS